MQLYVICSRGIEEKTVKTKIIDIVYGITDIVFQNRNLEKLKGGETIEDNYMQHKIGAFLWKLTFLIRNSELYFSLLLDIINLKNVL